MNAFIVEIPDDWSDEKRKSLYDVLSRFAATLHNDDGDFRKSRLAFTTDRFYDNLDDVRSAFQIPDDVRLIDGHPFDFSRL